MLAECVPCAVSGVGTCAGGSIQTAQTRNDTRQIGGHYKPEVAQTLKLIAAEQDRDGQEILTEALNMVFTKYGKPTRAEVASRRRKTPQQ